MIIIARKKYLFILWSILLVSKPLTAEFVSTTFFSSSSNFIMINYVTTVDEITTCIGES
jgi:hypothetical protein